MTDRTSQTAAARTATVETPIEEAAAPSCATPASGASGCAPATGDEHGIIVYVASDADADLATSLFAQLDDPPSCCRLRTRMLTCPSPDDVPDAVGKVWKHTGTFPLPLTVVDGFPVVAGRVPSLAEFVHFTTQETTQAAEGLIA
jgi:hypothetical protein